MRFFWRKYLDFCVPNAWQVVVCVELISRFVALGVPPDVVHVVGVHLAPVSVLLEPIGDRDLNIVAVATEEVLLPEVVLDLLGAFEEGARVNCNLCDRFVPVEISLGL